MWRFISSTFPLLLLCMPAYLPASRGHMYLSKPVPRSYYDLDGKWFFNDCGFRSVLESELIAGNKLCSAKGLPEGCFAGLNCGICGDNLADLQPRLREYGFPSLVNPRPRLPTITYRQGAIVPLEGSVANPHGGYYQFRVSDNQAIEMDNISTAQAYFDQNILNIILVIDPKNRSSINPNATTQVKVKNNVDSFTSIAMAILPPTLHGDLITLQHTYLGDVVGWRLGSVYGNASKYSWANTYPQRQVFRSCADIRIVPKDDFSFLQNKKTSLYLSANYRPVTTSLRIPTPLSVIGSIPWDNFFNSNGSIMFVSDGRCLDVDGWKKTDGATVGLWGCSDGNNQGWWFKRLESNDQDDSDYFLVINKNSKKCLCAQSDRSMVQNTCSPSDDCQAWRLRNSSDYSSKYLQNKKTRLYLSRAANSYPATSLSRQMNLPLQTVSLNSSIPWDDFFNMNGSIVFELSGLCLDVQRQTMVDGAPVVQARCQGSSRQEWSFMRLSDQYFQIVNKHSKNCLTTNVKSETFLDACDSSNSFQSWKLYDSTDESTSYIQNKVTLLYLSGSYRAYPAISASCQLQSQVVAKSPVSLFGTLPWENFFNMKGSIVFEYNGLCLEVSGQGTVGQGDCGLDASNQGWSFTKLDDDYFQIVYQKKKCLCAESDGTMDLDSCNPSDTCQSWKLQNSTNYCT